MVILKEHAGVLLGAAGGEEACDAVNFWQSWGIW